MTVRACLRARYGALLGGTGRGLADYRDLLIRSGKAVLSAVAAWLVTRWAMHSQTAVFAPYAALLTVSGTVVRSFSDGLRRTAVTIAGVGIAFFAGTTLGFNVVGLAVMLFLASLIGYSRRLGAAGVGVPATALFVLVFARGTETGYLIGLLEDTAVGAALGVAVNGLVVPPVHVGAAGHAIRGFSHDIGELLHGMADDLPDDWSQKAADRLEEARRVDLSGEDVRRRLHLAEQSLRFNPRARVEGWRRVPLQKYAVAQSALQRAASDARNVARTFRDAADDEARLLPPDGEFLDRYGDLLHDIAGAVDQFGREGDATSEEFHTRLDRADARWQDLAGWQRPGPSEADPTYGSLLRDAHLLLYDLRSHGAQARVPTKAEITPWRPLRARISQHRPGSAG